MESVPDACGTEKLRNPKSGITAGYSTSVQATQWLYQATCLGINFWQLLNKSWKTWKKEGLLELSMADLTLWHIFNTQLLFKIPSVTNAWNKSCWKGKKIQSGNGNLRNDGFFLSMSSFLSLWEKVSLILIRKSFQETFKNLSQATE